MGAVLELENLVLVFYVMVVIRDSALGEMVPVHMPFMFNGMTSCEVLLKRANLVWLHEKKKSYSC